MTGVLRPGYKQTEVGVIPDWETKTLGDAITFQRGYDLTIFKTS